MRKPIRHSDKNDHSQRSLNARHRIVRHDGETLGAHGTREGAERLCAVLSEGQPPGFAWVVTRGEAS